MGNKNLQKPTPATNPLPDTKGARTSGQAFDPLATPAHIAGEPTDGTPPGAGRAYETGAPGSANVFGKASATAAGGNPVSSPVIGNPGETRTDMAYDYALAGAVPVNNGSNPRAATRPMESVPMLVQVRQEVPPEDDTEYAELVRARQKGHYDGLREVGDVFNNVNNLATYPEDPHSWFEDASKPTQPDPTPRDRLRARKAKK